MRFCPSCDRHLFDGTFTCPFCQAPCGTVRSGSLAILGITLGVALTACGEPKPGGTADENTNSDDPEDSFDAYGATYTVSGDSPSWSETRTTSTETDNHTATGTATDTDTDTGTDTGNDTGTTGAGTDTGTSSTTGTDTGTSTTTTTDTGTSTTTTTDTGSTGAASSTG